MKTKYAFLLAAAIAATTCAYADGGPDASRIVEGKKVELAAFQGADKLLNRGWRFRTGDDEAWAAKDFDDTKWRWVDAPHDFEFELPWNEKAKPSLAFKSLTKAWYRKRFTIDPAWKGKRVFAEFEAIMAVGDVFLNGNKVASTEYGYLGCVADLTDGLDWDGENVLAVRADAGKQSGSRWYTGGGLIRDVHLFAQSPIAVQRNGFYIKSGVDGTDGWVDASVQLDGYTGLGRANRLDVIVEVFDIGGKRVAREAVVAPWSKKAHQEVALPRMKLPSVRLWDIDSPNLYTATATLRLNGTVIDRVKERFGVRTIEYSPDFGFKLNGRKVFIQGMANHHDLGALGAASFDRAIERQFKTMKEFGFNAVRCSHNPYSKGFLRLADEMGILVIDEFIDKWGDESCWNGRLPLSYIWHGLVTEWVRRDRNHPSIILWSLGNELQHRENACGLPTDDWGVTTYRLFDVMVKRWDSTRPTTVAMFPTHEDSISRKDPGFDVPDPRPPELSRITEVASFNYMYEDYAAYKKAFPELTIFQSEASVHALQRPYVAMDRARDVGLCWWGAIAYWGESDGWPKKGWNYSFFDRTLQPYPTAYLIKSFLVDEPMAEIAVVKPGEKDESVIWNDIKVGRMNAVSDWTFDEGTVLPVIYVYTNAEEAELFVNGKSLGVRKNNETDMKTAHALRWANVSYEPGKIEAVARSGGKEVARRVIETAGEAVRLEIAPENHDDWNGDGNDLLYVRVRVVDDQGRLVRNAVEPVTFKVEGAATLLAVDDGDANTELLFRNVPTKNLKDGALLAILRSKAQKGKVAIEVSSPSLGTQQIDFETK